MASELESDLRDTIGWVRKWHVDFNTGKTQLVLFDRSNNSGSVDVKMEGFILEKKLCFKMTGLSFSSELDWSCDIVFIPKIGCDKKLSLDWSYEVSFS